MKTLLLSTAACLVLASPVFAAQPVTINNTANSHSMAVNADGSINVSTQGGSSSVTGSVSAATIGASSAQILAAAPRRLLAIDNESTSATIACAFGATAAINSAGSFTIPPGTTRTWSTYPVPADAVNCIASAASTPATVEAN